MALADYRTALVTGASAGIGAAVVRVLRERGLEVHAVARRRERLDALARETGCRAEVLDLRDTGAVRALGAAREWDVVVNNAGVILGFEPLHEALPEDIDAAVDTNVRAVYHLLHAALPGMIARRRGHVVNVGSMAGLYALRSTVYGGTKAAVHLLSQNLRIELQGTGVRSTEICPGRVRTDLYDVAIHDAGELEKIKDSRIRELEPGDVAAATVYALDTPWHVNVNRIEIQPLEQTYGGSQFVPVSD